MSDRSWKRFNRKKAMKKAVAGVLKSVGKVLFLDHLVETRFERTFEGVEALPQEKPYLVPQEYKDEDEDQIIQALIETFVDDTTESDAIPQEAALDGDALSTRYQDPHWGHTTCHLFGKLDIHAGIEELDPDLRKGLFADKGVYDVYCRPNFLYDAGLPIAINRLSLKLRMPTEIPNVYSPGGAKELDLLLSEGLPDCDKFEQDGQGFFFRDARQLLMANEMKDGLISLASVMFDGADAEVAKHWKTEIFDKNTNMLYRGYQTRRPWDRKWYYSAGPYRLGPGVMKFALEPANTAPVDPIDIFARPDMEKQPFASDYHPALAHQHAYAAMKADDEVLFTLKLQIATPDSIPDLPGDHPPNCVMAAEYTDIAWNAPFLPVGTLSLRPHNVDLSDAKSRWYAMGFNAWNTFEEMEPLGQLFRARKQVHLAHREARLKHSFNDSDASPALTRCPFS